MPENWWKDPTTLSVISVLSMALWALLQGKVFTAGHVASLKESYEAQIKVLKEAYETRIVELTTDRNDYKAMLRDAVAGWKKTLSEKGIPERQKDKAS